MTHAQSRRRRKQMARLIKNGTSMKDVCQEFGVCPATVAIACREAGVVCVGEIHAAVRERNSRICQAAESGRSISQICTEFKVSDHAARKACRESGIKIISALDVRRDKICDMARRGMELVEIAKSMRCTKDSVRKLAAGLNISFKTPTISRNSLRILFLLLTTDQTLQSLAEEFQVSRQRVDQIRSAAEKAGFIFKRRQQIAG